MLSWAMERIGLKPQPSTSGAERRKNQRYSSTLPIMIEGKRYGSVNWSAGGLGSAAFTDGWKSATA